MDDSWNFYVLFRFGFVDYASVEEARAVLDQQGKIELDGQVLIVNYSERKLSTSKTKKTHVVREYYQISGKSGNKFLTKKFFHQYNCEGVQ